MEPGNWGHRWFYAQYTIVEGLDHWMTHRFLVDEMLGDVMKWLRILGFEAVYRKGYSDRTLVEKANRGFVLVTSDRELFRMSSSRGLNCILLQEHSVKDKLVHIFRDLDLKPSLRTTRCAICGGRLEIRRKSIPKRTDSRRVFWTCTKCGKMYWRGSHWRNIGKMIANVRSDLSAKQ